MMINSEKTYNLLMSNNKDKILIVDDELPVVLGIKRALRGEYHIDVAVGASQAIDSIKQHGPYAVIISDLRMPGIDGIDFLSEVKRRWPDTVRILLTGDASSASTIQAINKAGVFRFLQKPFEMDRLRKILTQSLTEFDERVKPKRFDKDLWAHFNNDMKDPLRCLMDFADFMKHEATVPLELHAYADYVTKNGTELVAMSDAAAVLSAIESGRHRLKRKKVCLKSLLKNTQKTLAKTQGDSAFIVKYEGEIPDLRIDGFLCEAAICALVEDALQFNMDASTITLTAYFDAQNDETLIVELADKGPQIDIEQASYFVQSDPFSDIPFYRNRGVGLRLHLVKAIAELHGGSLELFNRAEKSFTTTLKLPKSAW